MSSIGLNNSIKKKKKTLGRQKIEIKEIQNANHRQVTFSKRRAGLFKKASELCVLTGAEVSAIVTSRANRTFAFSSRTDPTDLMNSCVSEGDDLPIGQDQGDKIGELNERYSELMAAVEEEERRGKRIAELKSGGGVGVWNWWEAEMMMDGDMNVEELEIYMLALKKLERNVEVKADELMMERVRVMAADPFQMLQSGFFPFSYDPNS